MTSELSFEISWEQGFDGDPLEAATYGSLGIRLGEVPVTLVHDRVARTTRDVIRVSAYPLALWFVANWWRLRWEGPGEGVDWKLSHQLGGAGGGYVWPKMTFASDGELMHVRVRRHVGAEWESISYLNDVRATVPAGRFEAAVGGFVNTVVARLVEAGHPDSPLSSMWATVQSERQSTGLAHTRRLEALLAFDAEEAPSALLEGYADGAEEFGAEAVAELAAEAGNGSVPDWSQLSLDLAAGARLHVQDLHSLRKQASEAAHGLEYPWQRGEAAARAVRSVLGTPRGPLSDAMLQTWLGADLAGTGSSMTAAALARREQEDAADLTVCYRSAHHTGRRFELARLLADHLIAAAPGDTLLPATRAKTARQSVQRAFAAELLLPLEDLIERVGVDPDDETLEAAAQEFLVSPLVVRTRLVNKGRLPADMLDGE